MKIKRKPLTPEQQAELDRNWEYMCSLILSKFSGKLVTPEEYEQEKRERQARDEAFKRRIEQEENINSWKQIDFETLNTLLINYKETNDETYFNQAWEKYLKNLTQSYLNKYVIRGLTVTAKKLFLVDHQYHELQDVLYPVKPFTNGHPMTPPEIPETSQRIINKQYVISPAISITAITIKCTKIYPSSN